MHKYLIFAALFAVGCDGGGKDTGDTGAVDTGDTSDTGDTGTAEMTVAESWNSTGITVNIENATSSSFLFGMAETSSANGWYGEDCIEGPGPNSGDYDYCHTLPADGGSLTTVFDPDDIVEGTSTLFNETIAAAGITYVLIADNQDCWTWGHDTSYYTAVGCTDAN